METPSRVSRWSEEMFQLRKKVGSLKVMLQKINLERELTPEQEEEDMEFFLRRMAIEYIQTRQDSASRKKLGF